MLTAPGHIIFGPMVWDNNDAYVPLPGILWNPGRRFDPPGSFAGGEGDEPPRTPGGRAGALAGVVDCWLRTQSQ